KQKLAVPYVSYYNDSKKYTPSTLAVLEIDHTKRNESLITLGEGTPSSPLTTKKMYPIIDEHGLERCLGWRAGDHPFSNSKVVIDMTRIVDNDGKDFFLN
ncbi:MAG: hypothetical protein GWO20_20905, partial [Candidatus Korarchaeota archaeon]|nr:hypothetical protein [Candidatus Korarchaeota archaeon]